jgi:hypothetical protein
VADLHAVTHMERTQSFLLLHPSASLPIFLWRSEAGRCFTASIHRLLGFDVVSPGVITILLQTCREYRSYIIKYFVNCCETEGIIYS